MAAWSTATFQEDYTRFLASDKPDGVDEATLEGLQQLQISYGYDPLSPGIQEHYTRGEFLGKGGFGEVYSAKMTSAASCSCLLSGCDASSMKISPMAVGTPMLLYLREREHAEGARCYCT